MKYLLLPFRVLYLAYALLTFAGLMILVFVLSVAASFLGDIRGGNAIYLICRAWADSWFFLVGIRTRYIFEHRPDPAAPCIYVANHISYLDAALIVKIVRYPVRPLGKIELSRVPLFGFIYRRAIVVVDRADAERRARSVRQLKAMLQRGISIFLFPEGTFNETGHPVKTFFDGAFRIAIETQTPLQPVLFLDAFSRLHYKSIFTLKPGKCRAVFLPPIPVAGLTLQDMGALKEKTARIMAEKLKQYKAPWITQP